MAEVRMKEHVSKRLKQVKRRSRNKMQTAQCIQIYTVSLEDSDKEKNHKIGYQQIVRNNRNISHNGCKITVFL
jgi:hypothetical protein